MQLCILIFCLSISLWFCSFVSPDNVVVDVQSKPETSGVGKSSWLQILVYSPYHATHQQSGDLGSSQEDSSGQEGGFRFYQVCYKLHAQVREDLAPTVSTTARASGKVSSNNRKCAAPHLKVAFVDGLFWVHINIDMTPYQGKYTD